MSKNITITLTIEQAEKLSDTLFAVQDEGPLGGGWRSKELELIRGIVNAQLSDGLLRGSYCPGFTAEVVGTEVRNGITQAVSRNSFSFGPGIITFEPHA